MASEIPFVSESPILLSLITLKYAGSSRPLRRMFLSKYRCWRTISRSFLSLSLSLSLYLFLTHSLQRRSDSDIIIINQLISVFH